MKMKKLIIILILIILNSSIVFAEENSYGNYYVYPYSGIVLSGGKSYHSLFGEMNNLDLHLNYIFYNASLEYTQFQNNNQSHDLKTITLKLSDNTQSQGGNQWLRIYLGIGLTQLVQFQVGLGNGPVSFRMRTNLRLLPQKSFKINNLSLQYPMFAHYSSPRLSLILSLFIELMSDYNTRAGFQLGLLLF